ncbi:hypothetical protein B9M33_000011 [Salmonella enterica subsp. enterica serovar Denver]|nr:hypothetical protein [Salmonella enterica subsp. enterica serovar Denver]
MKRPSQSSGGLHYHKSDLLAIDIPAHINDSIALFPVHSSPDLSHGPVHGSPLPLRYV